MMGTWIWRNGRSMALIAGALSLAGCGGGRSGGESLSAQYQRALKESDATLRVSALLKVADKQNTAGDAEGTDQSLVSAADAAKSIEDVRGRAVELNRVATASARLNRTTEAKKLLETVEQAVQEIKEPEAKIPVIARSAYVWGKYLGSKDQAVYYLGQCAELAQTITQPDIRIDGMLEIVYTYNGMEDTANTQKLLDETMQAIRGLEELRKRADAMANAAAMLSRMKKADEAKAAFEEAEKMAAQITDPLSLAYAYVHQAEKLSVSGLKASAQRLLGLAESAGDKVQDLSMRGPLTEKIATVRSRL